MVRTASVATCLIVLGLLACTAPAALIVHEGFDTGGTNGSNLVGQAGATSVGFDAASTWGNKGGSASVTYRTAGLSIGSGSTELAVIGGAARMTTDHSATWLSRGLDVTVTGTVYGAYLYNRDKSDSGANNVASVMINKTTGGKDNDAEFTSQSDEYPQTNSGMRIEASAEKFVCSGTAMSDDTTYIVLFSVSNLGGTIGTVDASQWVLTSSQFDNFRPGGLTAAELDGATLGTGSTNVLQRGAASYTPGNYPRLTADDVLGILGYENVHDVDEIRRSNTNLTEATPVVPEPATLILLAAGLPALLRPKRS